MQTRRTARGVRRAPAALALLAFATLPAPASSQTFHGRVVDVEGETGVRTALVRLLDPDGRDVAFALADSLGRYRLEAPGPGAYRLAAERIGYATMETPLLRVEDPRGAYAVDLTTRKVPVPIPGIDVSAARQRELERAIHQVVGTNPRSLRTPPIPRRVIEDHLAKGHGLPDLVRWTNAPIVVKGFGRNMCFEYRGGCMRVFLNGVPLPADFWDNLPLDMVETVVLVGSNESVAYGPSLLLYTAGWLR